YSVKTERRFLARFADAINSRTVVISSSTVSGVKEASPSAGQIQAKTLGTRTVIPSSLYSKVVGSHCFGVPCSKQIGILSSGIITSFVCAFLEADSPTSIHQGCRQLQIQYIQHQHTRKQRVSKLSEYPKATFCHISKLAVCRYILQ